MTRVLLSGAFAVTALALLADGAAAYRLGRTGAAAIPDGTSNHLFLKARGAGVRKAKFRTIPLWSVQARTHF